MRIFIAFVIAFGFGAGSRWTGVPSLAPQAIVGALLIVAMSTGGVATDRILSHKPAASVSSSEETRHTRELPSHIQTTTRDDRSRHSASELSKTGSLCSPS